MLYRIAEATDWQWAQQTGFFASADLAAEGFIHTSKWHQILETARRYYAGQTGLVLLELDEKALEQAGVRVEREWAESRQEFFAHAFAPIPLAAVSRCWNFEAGPDGEYMLPEDLASEFL